MEHEGSMEEMINRKIGQKIRREEVTWKTGYRWEENIKMYLKEIQ